MALKLYRRHAEDCRVPLGKGGSCRCAVWMRGMLDGKPIKESMKTRVMAEAERRLAEVTARPEERKAEPVTFERARDLFIAKLKGEGREADTIRKYALLFSRMEELGLRRMDEFTNERLIEFRAAWKESPATRNKALDRLKAFFRATHEAGLIATNPAKPIKPAKAPHAKVKPFSADEQARILAKPQTSRYRAFVHTLYHSGLRMSDACFLKPSDFQGDAISRVSRKNGVEVFVPIPPYLKAELDKLTLTGGYYFLIGESENLHTQTDAWRTILSDLFKADIPGFHPHRFRHTRVVEWLAHGITMEEVAGMIGTSVKVLEKHYASFAPARKLVVSEKLGRMWDAKPKLIRMK